MKDDARTIGLILKRLRERHGMGVSELARLIGVDKSYISKVENGKKYCSHKVQLKILSQFNKKYQWLSNEVSKRRNDYFTSEELVPDFSRMTDKTWLKELSVDKPFYEKTYYKNESEKYWNNQEEKSDLSYEKALNLHKRRLSPAEAMQFFEDKLNPLILKNYFKTSLVQELTQEYTDMMIAYEKDEWKRRLIFLQKLNKLLKGTEKYDLAVGRDDILLTLRDFKNKHKFYLKKVLNSSELKFVEHIPDGRGRPSTKEKLFSRNEYEEYSLADSEDEIDFDLAQDLEIDEKKLLKPEDFHNLLFKVFYKVIKKNSIIKEPHEKRDQLLSAGLLISSQLCCYLRMSVLSDTEKEIVVLNLNLEDLNFEKFTALNDSNTAVLKADHPEFQLLSLKLKSILSNLQKIALQ